MIALSPPLMAKALTYLSGETSTAEALANKLGLEQGEAEALEIDLVAERLLSRQPGFYANPRYFLTDSGLVFLALLDGRSRDTQAVLDAIKAKETGSFFAGNRLAVYHACMALVQQGYLATPDGGGVFHLAQVEA